MDGSNTNDNMKQAINTRTQEEYDALMRYYESKGFIWSNGKKATKNKMWPDEKGNTCVLLDDNDGEGITYCSLEFALDCGFQIIPFTEFAKANIEPDYKALYLEGRELLEEISFDIHSDEKEEKIIAKIDIYLTKHNDLTNHKDGE